MPENREMLNFELALVLKNHLMTKDVEELRVFYDTDDQYMVFLCTVIYLLNHEPAFFFISNAFLEKIHSIIEIRRFSIKDEKRKEMINDITFDLNDIENCDESDRKEILSKYIDWEIDARNFETASIQEVLNSMSDDVIVYFHLKGSLDASSKEEYPISNREKIASINYLTEMVPEFFMNEEVRNRANEMIDSIYKETSFFDFTDRKVSKQTKQKIKSIFKEE